MSRARRAPGPSARTAERTYRAGCGRTWALVHDAPDLAFTALDFEDCAACPHRVDPEGTRAFCTLRPVGEAHPFAALAALKLGE